MQSGACRRRAFQRLAAGAHAVGRCARLHVQRHHRVADRRLVSQPRREPRTVGISRRCRRRRTAPHRCCTVHRSGALRPALQPTAPDGVDVRSVHSRRRAGRPRRLSRRRTPRRACNAWSCATDSRESSRPRRRNSAGDAARRTDGNAVVSGEAVRSAHDRLCGGAADDCVGSGDRHPRTSCFKRGSLRVLRQE